MILFPKLTCFCLIIYTKRKGRCFNESIVNKENATFDSFSKHHFFTISKNKKQMNKLDCFSTWYNYKAFLFIWNSYVCSASLNLGNSTDKFLNLMYVQIVLLFFPIWVHILLPCSDLIEIRESHFTALWLRVLFQDISPVKIFTFFKRNQYFW